MSNTFLGGVKIFTGEACPPVTLGYGPGHQPERISCKITESLEL